MRDLSKQVYSYICIVSSTFPTPRTVDADAINKNLQWKGETKDVLINECLLFVLHYLSFHYSHFNGVDNFDIFRLKSREKAVLNACVSDEIIYFHILVSHSDFLPLLIIQLSPAITAS